jgi:hypothetical protein
MADYQADYHSVEFAMSWVAQAAVKVASKLAIANRVQKKTKISN